jgi:hypothetical protein
MGQLIWHRNPFLNPCSILRDAVGVTEKGQKSFYIFRIFKFFIGPNKMSPLKTGIEKMLRIEVVYRLIHANKMSPLKTGIERVLRLFHNRKSRPSGGEKVRFINSSVSPSINFWAFFAGH